MANGAEDFFFYEASGFRQPGKDRGLDVEAAVAAIVKFWNPAAGEHRRALFPRQLIVSENLVAMVFGNERAGGGGLVHRPANAQGLGFLFERGDEAIHEFAFNVQAFGAETDLAGIDE